MSLVSQQNNILPTGRPRPALHWLIDDRPAPDKVVIDRVDEQGIDFARRISSPIVVETNSASIPTIIKREAATVDQGPPKGAFIDDSESHDSFAGESLIKLTYHHEDNDVNVETEVERKDLTQGRLPQQGQVGSSGLRRRVNTKNMDDERVVSSLLVGSVQRKDLDTTYTCLASNSNMTQASRATVRLQMNRTYP